MLTKDKIRLLDKESLYNLKRLICDVKVTVDLQRPNFANFFFFVPDIAKILI